MRDKYWHHLLSRARPSTGSCRARSPLCTCTSGREPPACSRWLGKVEISDFHCPSPANRQYKFHYIIRELELKMISNVWRYMWFRLSVLKLSSVWPTGNWHCNIEHRACMFQILSCVGRSDPDFLLGLTLNSAGIVVQGGGNHKLHLHTNSWLAT